MSIEEKAKAYEMALEAARKELGVDRKEWEVVQRVLHNIFPELRESEDERIRKAIIKGVSQIRTRPGEITQEQMLGWLEKQKEQKELPLMDGNADLYFDEWNQQKQNPTKRQCFEEGMRYSERLQKEQKPSTGIYWHAIKKGEKLPCHAYIWNPNYEKYHDCWEGKLIPNVENIRVGADTWYLPAKDVRDLPREGVDELPEEQKPDLPAGFYVTLPDGKQYYAKEMRCNGMNIKVVEPKPSWNPSEAVEGEVSAVILHENGDEVHYAVTYPEGESPHSITDKVRVIILKKED